MTSIATGGPIIRVLVAIAPLGISLLFAWLLMGPLSFGGGEKDVLLAIPLVAWSALFLVTCLVLWWRRLPLRPTVAWAGGVATVILVAAILGLVVLA